jgi:subtilase family serine protease
MTSMTRARHLPLRSSARTAAVALLLALPALATAVGSVPASAAQRDAVVEPVQVEQTDLARAATLQLRVAVHARKAGGEPVLVRPTPSGYTPAQVRSHLGLTGTGAGETIAIVSAYDAPDLAADLAVFNRTFGLAAPPSLRVVNQTGGSRLPRADGTWALETALDVQWAHAVAPDASILVVEATSSALGNLLAAVSYAAAQPDVTVISGSWGTPEFSGQSAQDSRCRLTTAVCVFASGDDGNPGSYPATMPNALAVGGTDLTLGDAGSFVSETAWSGSGGGISLYSAKPSFQAGISPAVRRAAPDVAYAAGEPAGFPVYSSNAYRGQAGWLQLSGTSVGAPQWAGILAAGNELRRAAGKRPLTAVDAAGRTPLHTALYTSPRSLQDIVQGTNGTCGEVCTALPGYDTVTGLGSPRQGLDAVLLRAP